MSFYPYFIQLKRCILTVKGSSSQTGFKELSTISVLVVRFKAPTKNLNRHSKIYILSTTGRNMDNILQSQTNYQSPLTLS